eukprot:GEZU01018098.1.p1 GENE.GEZU01018098.1~~GEZU01018098.1.p1  ORF type:complete len:243 (-),score=23.19 GEZU01018098.1:407-1042(-)
MGWMWPSGELKYPLHKAQYPIPYATLAMVAAKLISTSIRSPNPLKLLSPGFIAASAVQELTIVLGNLYWEYRKATISATERAEALAENLLRLRKENDYVRIVAHSLGCRHVIEAISLLDAKNGERPNEVHLCAPAVSETSIASHLRELVNMDQGGSATIYYSEKDLLLSYLFKLIALGKEEAIGSKGLIGAYKGVTSVQVCNHFDFWVHTG